MNDPPVFEAGSVFDKLYKDATSEAIRERLLALNEPANEGRQPEPVSTVRSLMQQFFQQSIHDSVSASEVHRQNIARFEDRWRGRCSTSTCFSCFQRPQYGLQCGHTICEDCIVDFEDCCADDPWLFRFTRCFFCRAALPEEVTVKVHPPTAAVGVLCIDGGGVRGMIPLKLMKRIQDRIGLSMPLQRFFRLAFGISSGKSYRPLKGKAH